MLTKVFDFFRGGSRDFNAAEKQILSFACDALPPPDRATLQQQIASVNLVQRQHPERLVVAYYKNAETVEQLPYLGDEHCLAKVSYKSRGKTKTTFLVLHDGRFMTFERSVPQDSEDIESLVKVVLHPDDFKDVAEEIDGEEHKTVK